jgi:aspartate/methionine/tyrosine aminotransferase
MLLQQGMSRLGTESAFEVLARANALAAQGKSIINLGIGQPDFKTPAHIVEAACKALRDGHHGYTPANGLPQLREAVAADLNRRHGVAVDPAQVVVVPGGKVTMFFAILMFGEPGAEIIYPNPGFPIYESAINFTGAKAVPLPLLEKNGFGFSAEDLLSRITPRTRLIIINSPANPTGGVLTRADLEAIAHLAVEHDLFVLADEIYSEILYEGEHHSIAVYPGMAERTAILDGFSKTYAMTGWRLGYGLMPVELANEVSRLMVNSVSCSASMVQRAGLEALTGPQDDVRAMVEAFRRRRDLMVEGLNRIPGITCLNPAGAFYVFPNITGTGMPSKEFADRLLEEFGVAALSGASFGEHGEGYLRLSYANSEENLRQALDRIEAAALATVAAR